MLRRPTESKNLPFPNPFPLDPNRSHPTSIHVRLRIRRRRGPRYGAARGLRHAKAPPFLTNIPDHRRPNSVSLGDREMGMPSRSSPQASQNPLQPPGPSRPSFSLQNSVKIPVPRRRRDVGVISSCNSLLCFPRDLSRFTFFSLLFPNFVLEFRECSFTSFLLEYKVNRLCNYNVVASLEWIHSCVCRGIRYESEFCLFLDSHDTREFPVR